MMIPPQKIVSRPASRGSLAREAGSIEQAGRSTANLHAEREASLLQAADTDAITPMRATQSVNGAHSSTKSASATPLSETSQMASRSQSPSPSLKLARSSTNSEGTVESDESNYSKHATSTSSQITPAGQVPSQQNPFLKPPHQRPLRAQRKSSQDIAGYVARPAGSPLTMQDLGSDYTRYFNPYFAGARSASSEKFAFRTQHQPQMRRC